MMLRQAFMNLFLVENACPNPGHSVLGISTDMSKEMNGVEGSLKSQNYFVCNSLIFNQRGRMI